MNREQQQSQDNLQTALEEHIKKFVPEGDPVLLDWTMVASVTTFGPDGERLVSYHMAFSNGEMEDHRAVGLMRVGEDLILRGHNVSEG